MAKKIVAAASLSRSEFETFLSHSKASSASKYRYETAWNTAHGVVREKPKKVKHEKIRYPIGEKRLNVDYKSAKEDFAKYDKKTAARYWSAWQKYQVDNAPVKPTYRIILSYRAKIDGQIMKDDQGNDIRFHWSVAQSDKKRLSKKELEMYAEEIRITTNVQVFDVRPEIVYNNLNGKQV